MVASWEVEFKLNVPTHCCELESTDRFQPGRIKAGIQGNLLQNNRKERAKEVCEFKVFGVTFQFLFFYGGPKHMLNGGD